MSVVHVAAYHFRINYDQVVCGTRSLHTRGEHLVVTDALESKIENKNNNVLARGNRHASAHRPTISNCTETHRKSKEIDNPRHSVAAAAVKVRVDRMRSWQ